MIHDSTPILIGAGQVTDKEPDPDRACSPLDLMETAARRAAADAGIGHECLKRLELLVIVKSFRESTRNTPAALARRLQAEKAEQWLTPDGGQTPQYLVNRYFEAIARGKLHFALLTGAEAINTARKLIKSDRQPQWHEPPDTDPKYLLPSWDMANTQEQAHGIWRPAHVYPLFENALREHYGETIAEHQKTMGDLFAPFTEVAAKSPHAWFPIARTSEEIARATPKNRFVGWPYTKYMNAMNQVNQSAALLICSVELAREMGVDESRWLYLHGCADTFDHHQVSRRLDYSSSPAIRTMGREAFTMAEKSIDDIDFIDLYSCFPSAVQIARDELGIARDDPRPLTVTGGLPFHGGAGNNYVMNSIATMADLLRNHPGTHGLITANGGYITKHAIGIYSTEPKISSDSKIPWQRRDPQTYQARIDALPYPSLETDPQGGAVVETYTVAFGRDNNPARGILLGRLGDPGDPQAPRFIANTPPDRALLEAMTVESFVGHPGKVGKEGEHNIFLPE